MYEFFEHTADLGLRIQAASLDALFVDAARGLFAAIVDGPETVRPDRRIDIDIAGSDREYLLFDWLRELLFRFDADQLLFSRFDVKVTENSVQGSAWGEAIDPTRHVLSHEVKAITYHGLRVEREGEQWIAEVIVDI